MLGHFLKRDFRDFLLWWVVIGIVTITFALLHLVSGNSLGPALLPSGYFLLFFAYFMFANLPMNYVLGSLWRTQHGWSRHYLLALPLSHWRLFGILHTRIAVFWLPLIVAASAGGVLFGWALRRRGCATSARIACRKRRARLMRHRRTHPTRAGI